MFRGSCTCNAPTPIAYETARIYYQHLREGKINIEQLMHEIRNTIKSLYKLPEKTGVFLMPSGSDAEYIPLLIAQ